MANQRDRRTTPKGIVEKVSGRKIEPNLLPATHKVQIMEYLLTCDNEELTRLVDNNHPAFVVLCARLLCDRKISEYMNLLRLCRLMTREEAINAK